MIKYPNKKIKIELVFPLLETAMKQERKELCLHIHHDFFKRGLLLELTSKMRPPQ